jgi:hypothetical protein
MTDETICNPIAAADVDGFTFHRDDHGAMIARCVMCKVGFVVTSETAEAVRANMISIWTPCTERCHKASPA